MHQNSKVDFFPRFTGYDWQTGRLDPAFMNVVQGKEASLPHLVQVINS